MRVLEPRILLDAAATETAIDIAGKAAHSQFADAYMAKATNAEVVDAVGQLDSKGKPDGKNNTGDMDSLIDQSEVDATPRKTEREIVFIDSSVDNIDELMASLEPGVTIHILDANSDGVDQIAKTLAASSGYDAIHIFSHGQSGALQLGNTTLDATSISGEHREALVEIGMALGRDGDILIYGCDFGKGEVGRKAAGLLAGVTGADIAASDDLTGSESLAGDWDLEIEVGEVNSRSFSAPDWNGILAGYSFEPSGPPVIGHLDNGIIGTPNTTATWANAVVYDPGGGPLEFYDVRATLIGLTDDMSASFETVASADGSMDDFRVVVNNTGNVVGTAGGQNLVAEGSVAVRWAIYVAGTDTLAPPNEINLTFLDIDGLIGQPNTQQTVAVESEQLNSYTVNSGTDLDIYLGEDGLTASGTVQGNNDPDSQITLTWASTNQIVVSYTTRTLTARFDMDGDNGLAGYPSPTTSVTQSLDVNGNAAGNDYTAIYVNKAKGGSDVDVPLSLTDVNLSIYDFDSEFLSSATVTLTNAFAGDKINFDVDLLASLGLTVTYVDTASQRVLTIEGFSLISNYETALQSLTYSNDLPDASFNRAVTRNFEFSITDGILTTSGVKTRVVFGTAGLAPVAGNNVYVEDEDTAISASASNGLLSDDADPQGNPLTVVGGTDANGDNIFVGVGHTLPSGSLLTINSNGSFTYIPQSNYSGNETITYRVSDGTYTSTSFATFNIQPVVDDVTLTIVQNNPVSNEDASTSAISVSAYSPDSSELQRIIAADIPVGVIITDGIRSFTSGNDVYEVEITDWDRTQLRMLPVQNSDVDITVTIITENYEVDGSSTIDSQSLTFVVDAVADQPIVIVEQGFSGVDQELLLASIISVQLFDVDGSEDITDISISNIPAGAEILINGVSQPIVAGVVHFGRLDIPNLVFVPPQIGMDATYNMVVSATVTETGAENGVALATVTRSNVGLKIEFSDTNNPVLAVADTASTFAGETVSINVLANDFVPDGSPVVTEINGQFIQIGVPVVLPAGQGTVYLGPSGDLLFEASATFAGQVQFTYTLEDANFSVDTATVTVSVQPRWSINSDPNTAEGSSANYVLAVEGSIVPGDTISIDIALQDGSADAADHATLLQAINDSIITYNQTDFSFDGTTVSYTAPSVNYSVVHNPGAGDFIDISLTGDALNLGDNGIARRSMGMDFRLYGEVYNEVFISADGYLTFNGPVSDSSNDTLDGSALSGNAVIAPFWDNLNDGTDGVRVETIGDVPGQRQFVVQWNTVGNVGGGGAGTATFQAILDENSGQIIFNYLDVEFDGTGDNASQATIGLQGLGGISDEFSFNTGGVIASGSSLVFSRGVITNPELIIDIPIFDDADFEDREDFSITISNPVNSALGDDFASVTIEYSDNQSPISNDDAIATLETGTGFINVLTNLAGADSDPEGQSLRVGEIAGITLSVSSVIDLPSGAQVTVDPNGSMIYNPNGAFAHLAQGEIATDTFTYRAADSFGQLSDTPGTVTVTITGENQGPTIDLEDDGTDPSTNRQVVYLPTENAMVIAAADSVILDPDDSTVSSISITLGGFIQPGDEQLGFGTAVIAYGTPQTTTAAIGGTVFQISYDGAVTITITEDGGGTMPIVDAETLLRTMTYENTSSDDERGTRTVTFSASDAFESGNNSVIEIYVQGNNVNPVAVDDGDVTPYQTDEEVSIQIPLAELLANDSDADLDPISIIAVQGGPTGSAVLDGAGNVTYTPQQDFVGLTFFTYTLDDGAGGTDTGSVFVNVSNINDAPRIDLNGPLPGSNYNLTYTENDPATSIIRSTGGLTDVDNANLEGMQIVMTGGQIGDLLGFSGLPAGITGTVVPLSAATGLTAPATVTIQLSGTASIADYETALRSIEFSSLSENPAITPRVVSVTADDGSDISAVATTTITVVAVNDAPVTVADGPFSVDEDNSITLNAVNLMSNDFDFESDVFTIVSVQDAVNGSVSLNGSGNPVFVPDPDYFGPASFSYTVDDGNGGMTTETVSLTVNSVNDLTQITLDTGSGDGNYSTAYVENDPALPVVDASVLLQDVDHTTMQSATVTLTNGFVGDVLEAVGLPFGISVSVVPSGPANADGPIVLMLTGTASIADYQTALQQVTYRSASEAPSTANRVLEIQVNDGLGDSNIGTTTISVTSVNDQPVAVDDAALSLDEDIARVILPAELLANDIDVDGDVLTVVSVQSPTNGTVVLNGDGSITFTPAADYFGPASFTYTVDDGNGEQSTATVNLSVNSVNDVTVIDLDLNTGGAGFATAYTEDQPGVPVVDASILLSDIDDTNIESATVVLNNGHVGDILEVGALPAGISASIVPPVALIANGTVTVTLSGTATLADYQTALQAVTFRSVSDAPSVLDRSISVSTFDGDDASNIANTIVTVTAVNDVPVAADDTFAVDEDTILIIAPSAVILNDVDPDGDILTLTSVQGAVNGTVSINGAGNIEFIPDPDYAGPASFTYTVDDGNGETSTATVNITINPVNDAPVIDLDNASAGFNFATAYTENAPGIAVVDASVMVSDIDNTTLDGATVTLVNGQAGDILEAGPLPAGITVAITPATSLIAPGSATVVFSGTASLADYQLALQGLTYRSVSENPSTIARNLDVSVFDGGTNSNTARSTIAVTAVNDIPVGSDDAFAVAEDTPLVIAPAAVLLNDVDPDGDALTLVSVQDAVNGTVSINGSGNIEFIPTADYSGPASFTYTAEDGNGGNATSTVNITVSPVNDAPVIDLDGTSPGQNFVTAWTENDPGVSVVDASAIVSDIDNTTLQGATVRLVGGRVGDILEAGGLPAGISASISPSTALVASGNITVTLSGTAALADYQAALAAITYRSVSDNPAVVNRTLDISVFDGSTNSNVARSTISVIAVNDAPNGSDDGPFTFDEDTSGLIIPAALLLNDSDPENDALTLLSVQGAMNGAVSINGSGQVVFVPLANYAGPASFTYTVDDGNGGSDTAFVSLTINSVNDAPTLDLNSSDGGGTTYSASWTEGDAPVSLSDASVALADVDHSALTGATIVLANGQVGDLLSVGTLPAGITASVSPASALVASGVMTLTLSGNAPLSAYEAALQVVQYSSVSNNPSEVSRTVSFTVTDGVSNSAAALTTITVTGVNDAPVAGDDGVFTVDEDTSFVVSAAALLFNDSDSEGDPISITAVQNPVNGSVSMSGGTITFTPDANYNGPASFEYTLEDNKGGTSTGSVNLQISAVNDAPVLDLNTTSAGSGYATAWTENTPGVAVVGSGVSIVDVDGVNLNGASLVLSNGRPGDRLTVSGLPAGITATVTPPSGLIAAGSVTVQLSGSGSAAAYQTALQAVRFSSISENPGNAARTVLVSVNDGTVNSATATSTIAVTAVNDLPVAGDDGVFSFDEDTTFSVMAPALLFNDTDPELEALSVVSVQNPLNGSVAMSAAGRITFTPTANYAGPASFIYTVRDASGGESTATVNLAVVAVNDLPSVDLNTGLAGSGHVTSYVENAAGTRLVDASVMLGDVDDVQFASATFVLTNGFAGDVLAVGALPAGIAASVSPAGGLTNAGQITVSLTGSASHADYQTALQAVTYRSISDNPNPAQRHVSLVINDGEENSAAVSTNIAITVVNDAPVAANDGTFTTDEDTVLVLQSPALLSNDTDAEGDTLSLVSVQDAVNGSVTLNASGEVRFTPDPAYYGPASFTYTVRDPSGATDTALVNINVLFVNDAPIIDLDASAGGSGYSTSYVENGSAISIVDTDVSIFDEDHAVLAGATVTLTNGQAGDVLAIGTLPTGITATSVPGGSLTAPGPMVISLSGSGSLADYESALRAITYRSISENPDTTGRIIEMSANDGIDNSNLAVTRISVTSVNDAPVAVDDGVPAPLTLLEDETLTFDPVVSNDVDVEDDDLTITQINGTPISAGATLALYGGQISLDANGTTLTYRPPANFFGPVSFDYTVSDGNLSDTATVNLEVVSVNDAPIATNDGPVVLLEDGSAFFDPITGSDTDVEGDALNITSIDGHAIAPGVTVLTVDGEVTLGADGRTLHFVPDPNYYGTTVVTYGVSDGTDVSIATVTFDVTPQDDPITIVSAPPDVTLDDGQIVNLAMAGFFDDPDDDPVLYSASGLPAGLSINSTSGIISGVVASDASLQGPYSVTLTADDGVSSVATTGFTLDVRNVAPVSQSDFTLDFQDGESIAINVVDLFDDPDGDALTYSFSGLPAWVTFDAASGKISGTAPADASVDGPQHVTLTADDQQGGVASVEVTLLPQNVAPVSTGALSDLSVQEEEEIEIDINDLFIDGGLDTDVLTLTVSGLPDGVEFDPQTGVISGRFEQGSGSITPYEVIVTADDGQGGTVSQRFSIRVGSDNFIEDNDPYFLFGELVDFDEFSEQADDTDPIDVGTLVNEISSLHGTVDLGGKSGILLSTIANIDPLYGATLSGSNDGMPEQIDAMDRMAVSTDWLRTSGRVGNGNWSVDGTFGYWSPVDETDGNLADGDDDRLTRLQIETIKRQTTLFIEFKSALNPQRDGTVVRSAFSLPDGRPLPAWMKLIRDGFISATPPAGMADVEIELTVTLDTGNVLVKRVMIDLETGAQIDVEPDGADQDPNDKTDQTGVKEQPKQKFGSLRGSVDIGETAN